MNRRDFLASAAALSLVPLQLQALTPTSAEKLVDVVVADINDVIASGKSVPAMIRDFEKIFERYADVEWIAGSALGPAARGMSNGQRKRYVAAFTKYISNKYGRRFNEFVGGRIEVNGAKAVKNYIEVKTTAYLQGESPFGVEFLVSDRTGQDRFFDMVVEGISLRLSEKEEIGAMLDKRGGDLNAFISDLNGVGN